MMKRYSMRIGAKIINKLSLKRMQNENFVWYVIFVTMNKEFASQAALKKLGVLSYLPLCQRWRRVTAKSSYRRKVLVPSIPGCMFVALPWGELLRQKIISARIRARVVLSDGVAAKLDGEILHQFIDRNKAYFVHTSSSKSKNLKAGDSAQIIDGVLRGNSVEITEIKSNTAIILAKIFGNIKTIKIPTEKLELITKEAA